MADLRSWGRKSSRLLLPGRGVTAGASVQGAGSRRAMNASTKKAIRRLMLVELAGVVAAYAVYFRLHTNQGSPAECQAQAHFAYRRRLRKTRNGASWRRRTAAPRFSPAPVARGALTAHALGGLVGHVFVGRLTFYVKGGACISRNAVGVIP